MNSKKLMFAVSICLVLLSVGYTASGEENTHKEPGAFSRQNPYKTGIVFNTTDILLDVESYQGGIGLKRFFKDTWAYRASFGFGYSNTEDSWQISYGSTFEYHFTTGRISPYTGFYFDVGYASYRDETDSVNWTKVWSIPISTGPIIGVEVEIFNILSLFVEYSIALDIVYTSTTNSDGGFETKESSTHYGVNAGMGNDSKIGIVIYFNREFKRYKQ